MATQPKDWQAEWIKLQAESRKLAKRANQRLLRLERAAKKPGMENILKYSYKSAVADIRTLGKASGKPRFKEKAQLVDAYDKEGNLLSGQKMYKQNVSRLKTQIKMMREFLDAASSTIGQGIAGAKEGLSRTIGIKRIWNKTTKTINKKYLKDYDLRLSDDDMKRFFDSKKQAKLEKEVGSGRMFIVASYIKKNELKTNKRDLEKWLKENIDLNKNPDLTAEDLKGRKGENYKQMMDRLDNYIKYTGDEVLDDYIKKALKKGLNVDNLFVD